MAVAPRVPSAKNLRGLLGRAAMQLSPFGPRPWRRCAALLGAVLLLGFVLVAAVPSIYKEARGLDEFIHSWILNGAGMQA